MNSVLVVCIGNICRSPMAEGILRLTLPGVPVRSAGIGALVGQHAHPTAVALLEKRGIDITRHVARQIDPSACMKADIIFVMDHDQRRYVERSFPFTRGKVFRIAENLRADVPDPYMKSIEKFEESLDLIDTGIGYWVKKIKQITEQER